MFFLSQSLGGHGEKCAAKRRFYTHTNTAQPPIFKIVGGYCSLLCP